MKALRCLALALLTAVWVPVSMLPGRADEGQGNNEHDRKAQQDEERGPSQSRGVISGQIVGVDYATGAVLIQSGARRYPVIVTPSTNIFQGKRGFATMADLSRGRRVQVWISESGGRLFAEIIRIH